MNPTGLRLMTPAYAAPEQIRGETIGTHTDVYSLGVVLYELLTSRLPFAAAPRGPGELERAILESAPDKPSALAPRRQAGKSAWADLDVLCLTAMQKDPERRYRSEQDAELHGACSSLPSAREEQTPRQCQ